jgi:ribosomal protein L37AE/L43A
VSPRNVGGESSAKTAMEEKLREIPCPACKKPLEDAKASGDWRCCLHCGKRVHTNAAFRQAVDMATMNEAWIEKIWWKASHSDIVIYLLDIPLVLSFIVMPAAAFAFLDWRLLFAFAPYIVIRLSRWTVERMFSSLFAYTAHFLVSSRGIIIVASYPTPFFLPWSSIVRYSWSSHVGSMTSQMMIEYATTNGQVASVMLQGEEKDQPLGELVDILEARVCARGSSSE